jgi:hypothetical protein
VIFPGLALPDTPAGLITLENADSWPPGRPSFVRTVRSPDGRFDPTRCRFLYPSWPRKPSGGRFADLANDPPRRANPPHCAPGTQLSKKQRVRSRAVAPASRRLSSGQLIRSKPTFEPNLLFYRIDSSRASYKGIALAMPQALSISAAPLGAVVSSSDVFNSPPAPIARPDCHTPSSNRRRKCPKCAIKSELSPR